MIKAVIFDCFGVLVSESWLAFKQRHFGHDPKLEDEAANTLQQADAGLISHGDFIRRIAQMSGLSESEVVNELDRNKPNERLFAYIASELQQKYKLAILSNAASDWLNTLFSAEQLRLFDEKVLSFQTRLPKPQVEAFEDVAYKLNCRPDECVFVDDQERHCLGAREAGMKAVLFENFDQARTDLEKLLA